MKSNRQAVEAFFDAVIDGAITRVDDQTMASTGVHPHDRAWLRGELGLVTGMRDGGEPELAKQFARELVADQFGEVSEVAAAAQAAVREGRTDAARRPATEVIERITTERVAPPTVVQLVAAGMPDDVARKVHERARMVAALVKGLDLEPGRKVDARVGLLARGFAAELDLAHPWPYGETDAWSGYSVEAPSAPAPGTGADYSLDPRELASRIGYRG